MKKWEYRIWQPTVPDLSVQREEFNKMGNDGWELVLFRIYREKLVFYFKRPAKE